MHCFQRSSNSRAQLVEGSVGGSAEAAVGAAVGAVVGAAVGSSSWCSSCWCTSHGCSSWRIRILGVRTNAFVRVPYTFSFALLLRRNTVARFFCRRCCWCLSWRSSGSSSCWRTSHGSSSWRTSHGSSSWRTSHGSSSGRIRILGVSTNLVVIVPCTFPFALLLRRDTVARFFCRRCCWCARQGLDARCAIPRALEPIFSS